MSDTVKTPCPLGKRVLLMKDEAPEMSEGGIVLPSDSQEKPLTAHIIALGSGVTRRPVGSGKETYNGHEVIRLEVGDEVVYASFAGTTFNIGGKEVIVVDEEDIMLVLREVPSDG